jgi:bifunctional non-homologous end joining protein LigD
MLATAGPIPTVSGSVFEIKFDEGSRSLVCPWRWSAAVLRNDRDVTGSYPEIAGLVVENGLVLDGELVASDGRGRPDFELLQRRMHVQHPRLPWWRRCPSSTSCSTCWDIAAHRC